MKLEFKENKMDLLFLKKELPQCKFQCFDVAISENMSELITVFICLENNIEILTSIWKEVSNLICIEYQTKLDSEFSRWNIYLVFLSSQPVDNKIKYEIENDKFSVRKIVIDNQKDELDDNNIIELLNERILSSDISLDDNAGSSDNQKIQLSELTTSLLSLNLPLGNTKEDKLKRSDWLERELERIKNHEV